MIDAFNAGCVSQVPEKGTVGASGDLAPLGKDQQNYFIKKTNFVYKRNLIIIQ